MGLEVNFNGQGNQDIVAKMLSKFKQPRQGKIETIFNQDGSKVERKFNRDGRLTKESIFKDINGDGKPDLYQITKFYNIDGEESSSTFIDKDGDGYSDEIIEREFGKNGKLTKETRFIEEDINEVKNRNHLEHEIHNRRMDTHYNGWLML